jgi:uncharacterized oligopeptide transporter (OPT) family protein
MSDANNNAGNTTNANSNAAPAPAQPEHPPIDHTSPQLTLRAVLTGMILGGTLSICNVYTGLKIGWGTNMSITGILIAFGVFYVLARVTANAIRPMHKLENNINQAACSAGAAVSSAGLVSAIPALTMIDGTTLEWWQLASWIFVVCLVGITVATGLRRQMVVVDKLSFASGIACAETLKEIYSHGTEALKRVGMLGFGAVLAGGIKVLEILKLVRSTDLGATIGGHKASSLTWSFDPSLLLVGVGGLIGFRACASMLLGAILAWGVIGPWIADSGMAPLSARETLVAVPKDVTLDPTGPLTYRQSTSELRFTGQMSEEQRDQLKDLTQDPAFRGTIDKLYAESRLALAAPLPALPPGVDLKGLPVEYDPQARMLMAKGQITRESAEKIAAVSPDPAFLAAGARLYEFFQFSTVRPLLTSVTLAEWPKDVIIPGQYSGILQYRKAETRLIARGPLPETLLADIRARIGEAKSKHPAELHAKYDASLAALDQLTAQAASATLPAPIPESLASVVAFDESTRTLRAVGVLLPGDRKTLTDLGATLDDARKKDWNDSVALLFTGTQYTKVAPNQGDLNEWLMWPGVTLMVVSSLVSFGFSAPSMMRAFRRGSSASKKELEDTGEVTKPWFFGGMLIALILAVILQTWFFEIDWWAAVAAVLLSFVLAVVAARVSGETNVTPVGAMGKVTQLVFAGLMPKSAAANLMSASVTAGAASQAADLMHDFKCGLLLGAKPRAQAVGQIMGSLAGAMVGSLFYLILVPNPKEMLLTEEWPAPAVAAWKAVAELFQVGFSALPQGVTEAMIAAAVVGVVLPIIDKFAPKKMKPYIPSAAAVGLAFVIPARNSVSMFLGGLIALVLGKVVPNWTTRFFVTICAGVVAGESLVGAGDAVRLLLRDL